MYLKKIIAEGFKSFADRVTINLDKNQITGIVGPNGSGKSNVIDAVRWVMGEQNAKMLRGEKSTDIIFSGSEKRKSLSQASVTLVFDNKEASVFCPPEYRHQEEIALTRTIYLDGEREYFINQRPCRLRDIIGFFASSGLGGRSYSMIQQGQVDRILQAKPEEIREILEEAAGIGVFKKRRFETGKKLEQTKLNLSRVDDILLEVVRQLEVLSSQVSKAKRWQTLQGEIRSNEISLFAHSYDFHEQKLGQLRQTAEQESLKEAATYQHLEEFETKHTRLKIELEDADPDLARLNEAISTYRERIASSESSLVAHLKFMDSGAQQISSLQEELAKDELHLGKLKIQKEDAYKAFHTIEHDDGRLRDLDEELSYKIDAQKEEIFVYEKNIQGMKDEMIHLDKSQTASQLRLETLEKDLGKWKQKQEDASKELMKHEEDYSRTKILLDGAQVKASSSQKKLDDTLRQKQILESEWIVLDEQATTTKTKLDLTTQALIETRANIASLEDQIASASDGKHTFELLCKDAPELTNKILFLADHMTLNEEASNLSKESLKSFEAWSERLICNDLSAIETSCLIAEKLQLSSLPLSLFEKKQKPLPAHLEAFGLMPLDQFVQLNDHPLFKTIDLAHQVFFQKKSNANTLDLQALQADHFLEGCLIFLSCGSVKIFTKDFQIGAPLLQGLLSRKQKLSYLVEKEFHFSKKDTEGREKLTKLLEKQKENRLEIKMAEDAILDLNKLVLKSYSELQDIRHQLSSSEQKILVLRQSYEENFGFYTDGSKEYQNLKDKTDSLAKQKHHLSRALEDASFEWEEILDRSKELKRQHDQVRFDLANIESRKKLLEDNYNMAQSQFEILSERFTRQRDHFKDLQKNLSYAEEERSKLQKDIEEFLSRKEEVEDALIKRKDANAHIVLQLRNAEKNIQESQALLQKCQKVKNDCALEISRSQSMIEHISAQALEKYQIQMHGLEWEIDPQFKTEKVTKKIVTLKEELDQIGPINMVAIAEHDELSERRDFIQCQKDEILSAIDLLETAVEEIEENSTARFLETFHTLNKEFSELFPILFPRGEGLIQLTSEEKPLDAGVEIMVRLPGKSRQSMRLFSGGEKALTAIALIFALLKSKPTPFCFLDEVDAPLDETNVGRYNNLLESLADRFQFIVITHRRKTMEVLDTLYGVTMQEPGVSKVVGVDMNKALPEHLQKSFSDQKQQTAASPALQSRHRDLETFRSRLVDEI